MLPPLSSLITVAPWNSILTAEGISFVRVLISPLLLYCFAGLITSVKRVRSGRERAESAPGTYYQWGGIPNTQEERRVGGGGGAKGKERREKV